MATTEGGLTDISPVNLNPQAEDCYYYYYSKCTKVCMVGGVGRGCIGGSGVWGRRWDVSRYILVSHDYSHTHTHTHPNRGISAVFVTVQLLWALRLCVSDGWRESALARSVHFDTASCRYTPCCHGNIVVVDHLLEA